jgi:hypothetical protein
MKYPGWVARVSIVGIATLNWSETERLGRPSEHRRPAQRAEERSEACDERSREER